jgi:hypothetical protein
MTHKERYPSQYNHPLVGRKVMAHDGSEFIVFRVVDSRFGKLAMSESQTRAFQISTLTIIEEQ